ncbi:hypothetical protein GCM10022260_25880 [Gaetbulibacter aestuarii]|uniref:hypothetical protein n=1 Tax=Gaetbulibacter aestuarii TaxID=1502358 RepID=UPI0031CFFBF3
MGQTKNQNSEPKSRVNDTHGEFNNLNTNDLKTLEKREEVKNKLKTICEPNQDIDELISSIENYCLIILHSLK